MLSYLRGVELTGRLWDAGEGASSGRRDSIFEGSTKDDGGPEQQEETSENNHGERRRLEIR